MGPAKQPTPASMGNRDAALCESSARDRSRSVQRAPQCAETPAGAAMYPRLNYVEIQ